MSEEEKRLEKLLAQNELVHKDIINELKVLRATNDKSEFLNSLLVEKINNSTTKLAYKIGGIVLIGISILNYIFK